MAIALHNAEYTHLIAQALPCNPSGRQLNKKNGQSQQNKWHGRCMNWRWLLRTLWWLLYHCARAYRNGSNGLLQATTAARPTKRIQCDILYAVLDRRFFAFVYALDSVRLPCRWGFSRVVWKPPLFTGRSKFTAGVVWGGFFFGIDVFRLGDSVVKWAEGKKKRKAIWTAWQ